MKAQDVQPLEGWLTTVEAGEALGTDKAAVYKMLFSGDVFDPEHVRRVGDKPVYLIAAEAIAKLREQRAADRADRDARAGLRASRRAVREWGRANGYVVSGRGVLSQALRDAYANAHPGSHPGIQPADHPIGGAQSQETGPPGP